ncbi:MAG: redoxin domain-containing protein [Candidatus Omnitrophica bacterium]|nr:redoxin domain-containing protein [Candidatus Omnitrophota bacterium]
MRRKILVGVGICAFALVFFAGLTDAKQVAKKPKKAPLFPAEGIWLNTEPSGKKIFQQKITLVFFWDYTSINCLREIEFLKRWHRHYHPYGLEMIFVHAPEYQFAAQKENVKNALTRFEIPYPVYLDNDFKVWDSYGVISWPTKFLVNEKGVIIHTQMGEGYYSMTERYIRKALVKLNPGAVLPEPLEKEDKENYDSEFCGQMSSETYLGYRQPSWWSGELANSERRFPDQVRYYKDQGERVAHGFFAHGQWANRADYFEHARHTDQLSDYLGIVYSAHEVYAVLNRLPDLKNEKDSSGQNGYRVYITRDDEPLPPAQRGPDVLQDDQGATYVLVQESKLYYLVIGEDQDFHELKLWPQQKGMAVNSFSFSNQCLSDFEHR